MQLHEVLELASEALKHSKPTHNYAEALDRHAKARRAILEAIAQLEEQHNFEIV